MFTEILKIKDIQTLNLEITSHCNIKCPQCSRIDEDGELAEYVELEHWSRDILDNLEQGYFRRLENMLSQKDHPGRCNTMCGHLDLNPSPIYFIQAEQDL